MVRNLNVALIGFGYWGPNLARNIVAHPSLSLSYIFEKNHQRKEVATRTFAGVSVLDDFSETIYDIDVQIVVIATPVETHYEVAKLALENKKHVLLEKPGCTSFKELKELHFIAIRNNCILMLDYTFLYHGAVRKINELIKKQDFGEMNYIDSTRINLGIFQQDINVLWDLASHDLAILYYLTGKLPSSIKADGISHTPNGIENIAYVTLKYGEEKFIVHLNCSWTSPVKIRQMLIGGEKKMLIYNDIEPTDKIKIYDCNLNFKEKTNHQILVDYRVGDIAIPKFDTTEALATLIDELYRAVISESTPLSSSSFALKISCMLEAAQWSIRNNGEEKVINYLEFGEV